MQEIQAVLAWAQLRIAQARRDERGEVVDGEIAQAGDQVTYTFDVAGTSLVYFDALTNNSSVHWSLTGPRGSLVLDRSFTSSDSVDGLSVMELREGTYRLTIDGSGDAAGAFRFRLADLDDGEPEICAVGRPSEV